MKEYESNNKLTFEWHSLLRDILNNISLVVMAAIIGIVAVYVSSVSIYKPVYTSSVTLIVNVKAGTYQSYTNLSASTEMATIFTEVFVQPSMKEKAAEYLGKPSFNGTLTASTVPNTNIINLSVTSENPQIAYEELKAVIEVYPQISDTIFSNAVIDTIREPQIPRSPSNSVSSSYKSIVVGGVSLLVLMAIVILSLMRDTVKNEVSYNKNIGSKLLGTVTHERKYSTIRDMLRRKENKLLIDRAFTSFRFSECYQKIATRFEYLNRNGGDKVFLVTSVAENEGKSTAAANIGLALAGKGHRVVLLDMDFMKPALNLVLGISQGTAPDLGDFISRKYPYTKLSLQQYKSSRLYVAVNSSRHSDYVDWINSHTVKELIDFLKEKFDYVIIDTPPISVAAEVASISKICDKSVLVVRTDFVQTADINDTIMLLDEKDKFAGCILNDVFNEFSFFGQLGSDETGHSGGYYGSYGGYSKYSSSYSGSGDIFDTKYDNNKE